MKVIEKVQACIHSLDGKLDEAEIIEQIDTYNYIAKYKGKLYKAIFNPFSGYYYVDDKYGVLEN